MSDRDFVWFLAGAAFIFVGVAVNLAHDIEDGVVEFGDRVFVEQLPGSADLP